MKISMAAAELAAEEAPAGWMTNLHGLLTCASQAQLRAAWLDLTEDERRELRPSRALAQHAWALIIRDRILTGAAA